MSTWNCERLASRALQLLLVFVFTIAVVPQSRAADQEDYDAYKVRINAFWLYAQPSGTFSGAGRNGFFDFQQDVGFNTYSTFTGDLDWKFTRKNHFILAATPFNHSQQFVLDRTIVFQGQTFNVGAAASASLKANAYVPGYQYDIIRRRRGHLGIRVQIDLFDTAGTLNAAAQVNNGVPQAATRSSASFLAPIPVAGPDVRFYLLPHSSRLFVTGNVFGMYLFGYGNFVSTFDTLGLTVNRHLSIRGGYALASRLEVKTKTDRAGLALTQKGPVVGIDFSF